MLKVGFVGPKEAGKTTSSGMMGELNGLPFTTLSFAGPLKNLVRKVSFDGTVQKPRDRRLLQAIGEYYRAIDSEYWIKQLRNAVVYLAEDEITKDPNLAAIFVDDVRFHSEAAALREMGFTLVKIVPPVITNDDQDVTETEWKDITTDYVIVNSKVDKIDLRTKVLNVLTSIIFDGDVVK